MKLILGGAYQGKLDYVREHYGTTLSVYHCTETNTEIDFSCDIINAFHKLALAQLRNNVDVYQYVEKYMGDLQSKIVICDDISCGVVPIDPEMRQWREMVGRSLNLLAKHSDEVIRIFCGLETRLK